MPPPSPNLLSKNVYESNFNSQKLTYNDQCEKGRNKAKKKGGAWFSQSSKNLTDVEGLIEWEMVVTEVKRQQRHHFELTQCLKKWQIHSASRCRWSLINYPEQEYLFDLYAYIFARRRFFYSLISLEGNNHY